MPSVQPDTIIDGRYRVIRRLGSGGMADVYCAEDQQLGRSVALKLLYRHFAEDVQFVERFRREASSAAGLQHPNIVGIFDRGEWDGTYYIAMEFIEGRTLKDVIRERGPAPPEAAVDIVLQILRAARFAHQRGIVHRDIKPHNVLIDDEGRVKVTDFGIARAGASDMTETGSIMGTAQYLSPEQAQGKPVDARSDLYSIGIVLYEMLTGRVPFDAESPVAVALKQVSEAPMPPRELNPEIPPALDAVVLRALEKDPARRYAERRRVHRRARGARRSRRTSVRRVAAAVSRRSSRRTTARPPLVAVAADPARAGGDRASALYLTLKPEQLVGAERGRPRLRRPRRRSCRTAASRCNIEPSSNADVDRDDVAAQDPRPETDAPRRARRSRSPSRPARARRGPGRARPHQRRRRAPAASGGLRAEGRAGSSPTTSRRAAWSRPRRRRARPSSAAAR